MRGAGQQIAVTLGASPGPARIELQLDPPELGRVEIGLDITDTGLRATVTAERGATGDLLRRHADLLMAQLHEAGFADIDLRFGESRRDGGAQGERPAPTGPAEAQTEPAAQPAPQEPRAGHDRLDLRL